VPPSSVDSSIPFVTCADESHALLADGVRTDWEWWTGVKPGEATEWRCCSNISSTYYCGPAIVIPQVPVPEPDYMPTAMIAILVALFMARFGMRGR
jgi:hypothetical protein